MTIFSTFGKSLFRGLSHWASLDEYGQPDAHAMLLGQVRQIDRIAQQNLVDAKDKAQLTNEESKYKGSFFKIPLVRNGSMHWDPRFTLPGLSNDSKTKISKMVSLASPFRVAFCKEDGVFEKVQRKRIVEGGKIIDRDTYYRTVKFNIKGLDMGTLKKYMEDYHKGMRNVEKLDDTICLAWGLNIFKGQSDDKKCVTSTSTPYVYQGMHGLRIEFEIECEDNTKQYQKFAVFCELNDSMKIDYDAMVEMIFKEIERLVNDPVIQNMNLRCYLNTYWNIDTIVGDASETASDAVKE